MGIILWLAAGVLTVLQYREQMMQASMGARIAAFFILVAGGPIIMINQIISEVLEELLPNDGENMTLQ